MKLFLVASNMNHYRRLYSQYKHLRVKRLLMNFIELSKLKRFSFDPSIEYIIDSGAHTFQQIDKTLSLNDLEEYMEAYELFVKRTCHLPCITFYAEMDIDNVVGIKKVTEWRKRLEKITDKIVPVWHPSREENLNNPKVWIKYCDKYKWVSLGGSWKMGLDEDYQFSLVKAAYDRGTKVHGMACTSFPFNMKVPFYSVDSSSWLESEEHGLLPVFDFVKMEVRRVNYKKTAFKGTDYISRTEYVIKEYKKFERGFTNYWKSRGLDWDLQIEKMRGKEYV